MDRWSQCRKSPRQIDGYINNIDNRYIDRYINNIDNIFIDRYINNIDNRFIDRYINNIDRWIGGQRESKSKVTQIGSWIYNQYRQVDRQSKWRKSPRQVVGYITIQIIDTQIDIERDIERQKDGQIEAMSKITQIGSWIYKQYR